MISLITGLPGHGKGVFGLDTVIKKAESENRTVYYHGVNDCKIPNWIELDSPENWYKVPNGSIVFLDEAQRLFRARANGSSVPPHVSELETHRHKGLDLYIVTQHPMLLDGNVRRLVENHKHIIRKFGRESAVVHEWFNVNERPDKSRKDSIKKDYSYNKDIYQFYKSAEVHTVKKSIPLRYWLMFIAPMLALGLAWYGYQMIGKVGKNTNDALPTDSGLINRAPDSKTNKENIKTPEQYLAESTPRFKEIAYSAPKYDEITKPVTAPYPAGCVVSKSKGCHCYTQQATPLEVSNDMCMSIVKNGYFIDWKTATNEPQSVKTSQGVSGAGKAPDDSFTLAQNSNGLLSRSSPNNN